MPTCESTWDWGLEVIRWIQQFHFPLLDVLMTAVTVVGAEEFYMLLVCFFLWSGQQRLGVRLAVWLALAGAVNADLKSIFGHPRPFQLDPSVQLVRAAGYGFPSGHAQVATVVWGYLASRCSQTRCRFAAAAAVLAIGFSRVYLGVHFPTDVLAGWAVGLTLLLGILASEPFLLHAFHSFGRFGRRALAVGVPVLLIAAYPLAGSARPLGMAAGLCCGYLLSRPPERKGSRGNRLLHFLAGISGLLLLDALGKGIMSVFPTRASLEYIAAAFLAGAALGFWASAVAPRLFDLMELSRDRQGRRLFHRRGRRED